MRKLVACGLILLSLFVLTPSSALGQGRETVQAANSVVTAVVVTPDRPSAQRDPSFVTLPGSAMPGGPDGAHVEDLQATAEQRGIPENSALLLAETEEVPRIGADVDLTGEDVIRLRAPGTSAYAVRDAFFAVLQGRRIDGTMDSCTFSASVLTAGGEAAFGTEDVAVDPTRCLMLIEFGTLAEPPPVLAPTRGFDYASGSDSDSQDHATDGAYSRSPQLPASWLVAAKRAWSLSSVVDIIGLHVNDVEVRSTWPNGNTGHSLARNNWARVDFTGWVYDAGVSAWGSLRNSTHMWSKAHFRFSNTGFCGGPLPIPTTYAHHWPTYVEGFPSNLSHHSRNTTWSGGCSALLHGAWAFGITNTTL